MLVSALNIIYFNSLYYRNSLNYYLKICELYRFHSWMGDNVGCVQMYNASEIMNMTVTVTDNISKLETLFR